MNKLFASLFRANVIIVVSSKAIIEGLSADITIDTQKWGCLQTKQKRIFKQFKVEVYSEENFDGNFAGGDEGKALVLVENFLLTSLKSAKRCNGSFVETRKFILLFE